MKKTTRKSGTESSGNIFIDLGFQLKIRCLQVQERDAHYFSP